MQRFLYRAQMIQDIDKDLQKEIGACDATILKLVTSGELMTATLYRNQDQLFFYYECTKEEIVPGFLLEPLEKFLVDWPGEACARKWVPMYDIFHYDVPTGPDQWKRKLPIEERAGRIARIKPEMLASYVFYHYQLQEERRDTGNKYCVIGLYENLIFHYEEHPVENSTPSFQGGLNTSNTPSDWKKLMDPHFIPWRNPSGESVNFIKMKPLISR